MITYFDYIFTSWTTFIINVFLLDNFPEEGLLGPTRVGGASQNKYLWLHVHLQWGTRFCALGHTQAPELCCTGSLSWG